MHARDCSVITAGPAAPVIPARQPDAQDWVIELPLDGSFANVSDDARFVARGECLAFFHGLLHDRSELARELGEAGSGEAPLVLAAYQRYGEGALTRFRGSFALAIVDRARHVVLVARDPLGTHPLFYAARGRTVLFAATPQALVGQPGVSRDLNRAALADRICLRWPDPGETYFAAVRRIPPGSRAKLRGGELTIARYWDPLPTDQPVRWSADDAQEFESVLNRAVDRCQSAGRPGIFLSGGLDSISVAAVAADRSRTLGQPPPLALSLGFPDRTCDERHTQRAVARQLGLPQLLVDFDEAVGPRGLLMEALDLNHGLASPVLNTWSPAYLALVRRGRTAANVTTILTGSGGDEWLAVSPYLVADLIRQGDIAGLVRFLGAWRRSYRHSTPRFLRSAVWTFGLRPFAGLVAHRLAPAAHAASRVRRLTSQDPDWIAPDPALRAEQLRRAPASLGEARPAQGFYWREVRTGLDHALASQELEEQYQFGQRAGVSFEQPYWDPDLVDMLYRLPPDTLNAGGRSKGLVRQTLARRFPTLGLESQRKVAATSFYRTLIQQQAPVVQRMLGEFRALASLGVVDARRVDGYLRQSPEHPSHLLYRVWDLLNLESWVRSQLAPVRG